MVSRALRTTLLALLVTSPLFAAPKAPVAKAGAVVLCYHIIEAPLDDRMQITRETFRQQMRYLEMTGYNVIPLRHLYEYVSGKRKSIPRNAVVITIDDGWSSAYTEIYPELKKRGFPFTLFIYPNIVGKTPIAISWEQVREMADAGVDIQSHSFSHPFLTKKRHRYDDARYASWLQRELAESRRVIEKNTGKPVRYLAYPYGDYDDRVAQAAAKAGYDAALTCNFGAVRPGSDPLKMNRFVIDKRMDFADFRRYLGAAPMDLADATPSGDAAGVRTVSARIPSFRNLDPKSVGAALLSAGSVLPYAYDASNGTISIAVANAADTLRGSVHRAVVWAKDAKTGKRVEATWTFRMPGGPVEPPPTMASTRAVTNKPAARARQPRKSAKPPATSGSQVLASMTTVLPPKK